MAVGFGVFWGIFPVWGYQMLICASLGKLLRINIAIAIIAANISIPPMIPVILYVSFLFGGLVLGDIGADLSYDKMFDMEIIKVNAYQYLVGAVSFAIAAGLFFGLLTFVLLEFVFRRKNPSNTDLK